MSRDYVPHGFIGAGIAITFWLDKFRGSASERLFLGVSVAPTSGSEPSWSSVPAELEKGEARAAFDFCSSLRFGCGVASRRECAPKTTPAVKYEL